MFFYNILINDDVVFSDHMAALFAVPEQMAGQRLLTRQKAGTQGIPQRSQTWGLAGYRTTAWNGRTAPQAGG